ncbi:hypothetical protein RI367_002872 [Sorochytrium milnesiophthora]
MASLPSLASESRVATTQSLVSSDEESIRVVVRARPTSGRLTGHQAEKQIKCCDDQRSIQDGADDKVLTYDRVFDENSRQPDLFELSGVKELLDKAIEGYAVTIFAYGQTGSGKTYTMTGSDVSHDADDRGIIPRSLEYLAAKLMAGGSTGAATPSDSAPPVSSSYVVRAGFVEIYNEQVQDLLHPTSVTLPLRWTQQGGFYVENSFIVHCESLSDCLAVLEEGTRNRTIGAHAMNERSSRSHAIMTLYLDCDELPGDSVDFVEGGTHGKVIFVDLAGSERVKETKTTGDTLVETNNINKSLLTLGNCISALSDSKKRGGHIPYRDSKLTKLLMDSLGGTGMALMIACISLSPQAASETIQTLRYASRAKRIRNRPVIRMDPREQALNAMKREIVALREENQQLRASLSMVTGVGGVPPMVSGLRSEPVTSGTQPGLAGQPSDNATAMHQLLQSYAVENDTLKYENSELLQSKQRTERQFTNLMREAEHLRDEIDRLQRGQMAGMPYAFPQVVPQWSFAPLQYPYQVMPSTSGARPWTPPFAAVSPHAANVLAIEHGNRPMGASSPTTAVEMSVMIPAPQLPRSGPPQHKLRKPEPAPKAGAKKSGKQSTASGFPPLAGGARQQTLGQGGTYTADRRPAQSNIVLVQDQLRQDVSKLDEEIKKQVAMIQ